MGFDTMEYDGILKCPSVKKTNRVDIKYSKLNHINQQYNLTLIFWVYMTLNGCFNERMIQYCTHDIMLLKYS